MRFGIYALAVGSVLVSACSEQGPVAGPSEQAPAPSLARSDAVQVQDRYIVVFRPTVTDVDRTTGDVLRGSGAQVHFRYRAALRGFAATIPAQALEGIRRNPHVELVEPDGVAHAVTVQNNPPSWGLDRIDQRDLPLSSSYEYTGNGAGVRAYILDTGIRYTHQEFAGRAVSGRDFVSNDDFSEDCHGHGTHVAGTVGGSATGVAKGVTLYGVRVLSCSGSGSYSGIIAGVDWVTQQKQANPGVGMVGNMSLSGPTYGPLNTAVDNSVAAGVVWAVAAGNDNGDACTRSPASAPSALTIGATTSTDARASFSNYGTCVDLFAPGSSIYSSTYSGDNTYASWSGTSMASPHAAGVAALYLAANPGVSGPSATAAIISGTTANKVTNPGTGSPNRLLYSLLGGGGGTPNSPPTSSFTFSCSNLACSFDGSESSDSDGTIQTWSWNFGDGTTGTGPTPNKTYASGGTRTVTLTVTDNGGATGMSSQNVTTSAPAGAVMHVADLDGSAAVGRNNWSATVEVAVVDAGGNAVAGALVSGTWSNGASGGGSCTTLANGRCSINKGGLKKGTTSVRYTVGGVTLSGATYNAAANGDPEGDSTGTTIVVVRP